MIDLDAALPNAGAELVGRRTFSGAPRPARGRVFVVLTAAAMGGTSVLTGLAGAPQSASGGVSLELARPAFATRERGSPRPWDALPPGVENRPASPMPLTGDLYEPEPAVAPAPPPAPETAAEEAPPAPAPRRDFRALVSFDSEREMTNDEVEPGPSDGRAWPPPPAQWNNPIRWITTHKDQP